MQYVRSISGSVSKTWNSINPATLSGAIDVIVVELEDGKLTPDVNHEFPADGYRLAGSLACSPFHVRFGKFSLLRPYEKKVQFRVNDVKQDFSMKLGEGGEAFFVFETSDDVPEALQTSPLVSPVLTPKSLPEQSPAALDLQEPEYFDLEAESRKRRPSSPRKLGVEIPWLSEERRAQSDSGNLTLSSSLEPAGQAPLSGTWTTGSTPRPLLERSVSDDALPTSTRKHTTSLIEPRSHETASSLPHASSMVDPRSIDPRLARSPSPPAIPTEEAVSRAVALSKKLSGSNIPTKVTDSGDLMLDMTGYKSTEDESLRADLIARKVLAEELDGHYDIGALIGADERGNLWIYSSEEAKEAASRKLASSTLDPGGLLTSDAASDPGYQSDGERSASTDEVLEMQNKSKSQAGANGLITPPKTPPDAGKGTETRNYAKTLRLTSEQLRSMGLKPGPNSMSFSVNKATCTAYMYYWKYNIPIVISDIDGTITKSDALGHVLNMLGRDWTHLGVAKLYSDIAANGYHIMYLTSRSVGQADTTRNYLNSVVQEQYKLPKGPVILSPDRTIAALRREVYLRKPEVFKMACLRDIYNLFGPNVNPFYAGFGNRLTDALSYRSVNIPSSRIFTINSNAEVSLDILSLNKYKSSYVTMRELVDHFFPPVGLLIPGGAERFTDFNFWREDVYEMSDFSASGSEDDDGAGSIRSEDEGSEGVDDDDIERRGSLLLSEGSMDNTNELTDSMLEGSIIEGQEDLSTLTPGDVPEAGLEESLGDLNVSGRKDSDLSNSNIKGKEITRNSSDGSTRVTFGSPKKLSKIAKSLLKASD